MTATWPVLAALVACVAAHVWLLCAAAKNKAVAERLQALAGAGAFSTIAEERPPGIFAEALAGLTVPLIPLAVWVPSRIAARASYSSGLLGEHFFKEVWTLMVRVGALNACAVLGPPVCLLAAFAWATALSWRLRIRGLERAAEVALDVGVPRLAAPYRASAQRHREVVAWLLHPGPRLRWLQAACSCFALTTAFPMGAGVHRGLADIAEVMGVRPRDPDIIDAEMARVRRTLSFASWTAFAGIVAGGAFLLAVLADPRRARRRLAPGLEPAPRARSSLLIHAACLSGAAMLTIATGPYASENADPLPLGFGTTTRRAPFASLPGPAGFEGPDAVIDGPVLDLSAKTIDGSEWSWTTLEVLTQILTSRRELWKQVQPDRPFPGGLAAFCGAATSSRDAVEIAGVARAAGYREVSMVLVRSEPRSRALLGDFVLYHRSAVNVEVSATANGVDVEAVRASEHGSCAELLRAAAEVRRRGHRVRLEL